ncbi:hypothetical protein SDJN03_24851, partial [Cucurbita argyrosperma subsp. sororia]
MFPLSSLSESLDLSTGAVLTAWSGRSGFIDEIGRGNRHASQDKYALKSHHCGCRGSSSPLLPSSMKTERNRKMAEDNTQKLPLF